MNSKGCDYDGGDDALCAFCGDARGGGRADGGSSDR